MTTVTPPPMAVVVVSFNTRELLRRCLTSVLDASPAEIVVVDNGSTDGSVELLKSAYPAVTVIASDENLGYGGAANKGIAACSAPAILLLNGDTVIEPGALRALGGYLAQHPSAAVVGPRLANADGSLQRSVYAYPSAGSILFGESGLHLLVRRIPWLRECFYRTWSHRSARRVPSVLGAALAIRRSAFEAVGGFDTSFFMYGEEVDLCRRLEAAGFATHFAPVTTVVHLGGASTGARRSAMRRELLLSRRRYLLRHESPRAAARVLGVLRVIVAARLVRDRLVLLAVRDPSRRADLGESAHSWRELLRERGLWRA